MSIDRNITLPEEERPDIIQAGCMIRMFMGKKYTIKPGNRMGQHLLPEIRSAVDHVMVGIPGNKHRNPQAFIPGVLTETYRMIAPYYRDPL